MKFNWKKLESGTLLLLTWDDILEDSSWSNDEKFQNIQPAMCKSVGWFINDDKLNIRIAHAVACDGDKSGTVIPKGVIRDVKVIKYRR